MNKKSQILFAIILAAGAAIFTYYLLSFHHSLLGNESLYFYKDADQLGAAVGIFLLMIGIQFKKIFE